LASAGVSKTLLLPPYLSRFTIFWNVERGQEILDAFLSSNSAISKIRALRNLANDR
jgi:hypothetical protein